MATPDHNRDTSHLAMSHEPTRQIMSPPAPPAVVFVINVDWFFVSHFLHLARAAVSNGWRVIVATELTSTAAHDAITQTGAAFVALPTTRGGSSRQIPAAVAAVKKILRLTPGATVHGFGQFGSVVGALAARSYPRTRRVFTVTGRGFAAADRSLTMRTLRLSMRTFSKWISDSANTRWIVENDDDIAASGLNGALREGRVVRVVGAGVDAGHFALMPMPPRPPIKLALVARMIWSKGIDVAVDAVTQARDHGCDVTLTLAGDIDPANPRSLTREDMAAIAARPGIEWIGATRDVAGLWRDHHIALLASRGGEGVPKSLIEAAACGRPILTTNVSGCATLAATTGGWSVAPDNVADLAKAVMEIARRDDLEALGTRARAFVLAHATESVIWDATAPLYGFEGPHTLVTADQNSALDGSMGEAEQ